jgi:hypothetical protein
VYQWVARAIAGIFGSKASLVAENLCLRQQLLVLQRRHPRPRLTDADRRFWIDPGQSLVLWLARDAAHREARYGDRLASEGMEGLLALEVASASK